VNFFKAAGRLLNSHKFRLIMSGMILISVMPLPFIRNLDMLFLTIFGIEFVFRVIIFIDKQRKSDNDENGSKAAEIALLTLDFIAVLSFAMAPISPARITRFARLLRLFYLSRTTGNMLKDFFQIARRRRYEITLIVIVVLGATFISGIIFSSFEIDYDFNNDNKKDNVTLLKALWWSFLQIEDPGNIIQNTETSILIFILSIFLTLTGVMIMSFIIGIGTNLVAEIIQGRKNRPVDFSDHIVAIIPGKLSSSVIKRLVAIYDKNRRARLRNAAIRFFSHRRKNFVLVAKDKEFPPFLYDRLFSAVDYRSGLSSDPEVLDRASIDLAEKIIIASDDLAGERADAETLSTLLAIRSVKNRKNIDNKKVQKIFVEILYSGNRQAAIYAGGENVHPIELGHFMGLLSAVTILFPGLEYIFDELFTEDGSEIYTCKLDKKNSVTTKELIRDYEKINSYLYNNFNTILIGYINSEKELLLNPTDSFLAHRDRKSSAYDFGEISEIAVISPDEEKAEKAMKNIGSYKEFQSFQLEKTVAYKKVKLDKRFGSLKKIVMVGCRYFVPSMIMEIVKNSPQESTEFEILVSSTAALKRSFSIITKVFGNSATIKESDLADKNRADSRWETKKRAWNGKRAIITLKSFRDNSSIGEYLERHTFDRLVLLAEPEHKDPDAVTILFLMNLAAVVERKNIQVVAEMVSDEKSILLEETIFNKIEEGRVHILPTGMMRSNLMVQSAYFENFMKIYSELLSAHGMDLCKMDVSFASENSSDKISFNEILNTFSKVPARNSCERKEAATIPIGLELYTGKERKIRLNPPPDEKFNMCEIKYLYTIGEIDILQY